MIRDTAFGFVVRIVTRNKFLQFSEERPDYELPQSYTPRDNTPPSPANSQLEELKIDVAPSPEIEEATTDLALENTISRTDSASIDLDPERMRRVDSHVDLEKIHSRRELELAFTNATLKKEPTRPIVPTRTSDGIILVDWYTTDDQENPQNWSSAKKAFVAAQIGFYTFAVYLGSAIFTPSEVGVVEVFGVSLTSASLGLGVYVLGYGIGPLLFAPLSEIPVIGRNPPYILTYGIFVILCVPTALVDNFAGLLVLRFLQGFFGSPCLATGGASLGDLYDIIHLPFLMTFWVASATCGPSLGPMIAGFSVAAEGWRWSLWEMLWISGPVFLLLFFCLPETSASTILLQRAARLRKFTGNNKYQSQSEIDQSKLTATEVVTHALVRPFQIMALDPAITFATIYTSLVYAIYYSFFEAFPLVYINLYGFNPGEMGLAFLAITVGLFVAVPSYSYYLYVFVNPGIRKHGMGAPERRLLPALGTAFLVPVGLLIFGWTSDGQIHWIVGCVGVGLFTSSIFIIFQCIFIYIPLSYPQYAASLFAGNDFARSTLSLAAILFAKPLFDNLGVARGVTLLAGLTIGCIGGIWALWYWGANLRARSRFTVK